MKSREVTFKSSTIPHPQFLSPFRSTFSPLPLRCRYDFLMKFYMSSLSGAPLMTSRLELVLGCLLAQTDELLRQTLGKHP